MDEFARPSRYDDDTLEVIAELQRRGRLRGRAAWADAHRSAAEQAHLASERRVDLARHDAAVKWEAKHQAATRDPARNRDIEPVDPSCEQPHRVPVSGYQHGCRCRRCYWGMKLYRRRTLERARRRLAPTS